MVSHLASDLRKILAVLCTKALVSCMSIC